MTWICGRRDLPAPLPSSWPTAQERVSIANTAIHHGKVSTTLRSNDPSPFIVSNKTAQDVILHNNLRKPEKHCHMLTNSLTNANGVEWQRQRPAIQRMFGSAKVSRDAAMDAAVKRALEYMTCGSHDIRSLCFHCAVSAMECAVFGVEGTKVREPLQALFLTTLEPIRGNAGKSADLEAAVRDCISMLHPEDCLAYKLRELEKDGILMHEEVIANCSSIFLAGTQTISTTLVGALAHTAECPQLQEESDMNAKAIVTETLRILPPVGSLPRCPMDKAFEIRTLGQESVCIQQGQVFLVDLLALAHVGNDESSWKFCPGRLQGSAAPWGLGKRQCPAGILSVSCISAILEALVHSGLRWTLAKKEDRVGEQGRCGWVASVSYQPTLVYPKPILLHFTSPKQAKDDDTVQAACHHAVSNAYIDHHAESTDYI